MGDAGQLPARVPGQVPHGFSWPGGPFDAVSARPSRIICGRLNVTRSVRKPVRGSVANRSRTDRPGRRSPSAFVCSLGLVLRGRGHGQDHAEAQRSLKSFGGTPEGVPVARTPFRHPERSRGIFSQRQAITVREKAPRLRSGRRILCRTNPDTPDGCQKLFGVVRSTRGVRVSGKPAKDPPRVQEADGHVASRALPSMTGGLARVSSGFLRRASGVTFQGLGWFLRSRISGRSAGRVRQWVSGCARRIDSRQMCDSLPGRPDEGDRRPPSHDKEPSRAK